MGTKFLYLNKTHIKAIIVFCASVMCMQLMEMI